MPPNLTIEIDLNAPVTWRDITAAGAAFFHWWSGQLVAVLPQTWRQKLQRLTMAPVLDARGPMWTLSVAAGDGIIASLDSTKPIHDLRDDVRRLCPGGVSSSIDVVLPSGIVLSRQLTVPLVAAHRLRSVVQLQLDRLSPFRADDVAFDCRVASDTDGDTVDVPVEVAIVPKSTLRAIEEKVRQIGLVPKTFVIADSPLSIRAEGVPWTKQRQLEGILLITAAIVWTTALWLAPVMRDEEIASLQSELSAQAPEVNRAEALRHELRHYTLPPQALRADRARALDLLQTMTRALPDTVHVTALSITDSRLSIQGTAPPTVSVKPLMLRTGAFENARIIGNQTDSGFVFDLALRSSPPGASP